MLLYGLIVNQRFSIESPMLCRNNLSTSVLRSANRLYENPYLAFRKLAFDSFVEIFSSYYYIYLTLFYLDDKALLFFSFPAVA